jgi:hypothetical protein
VTAEAVNRLPGADAVGRALTTLVNVELDADEEVETLDDLIEGIRGLELLDKSLFEEDFERMLELFDETLEEVLEVFDKTLEEVLEVFVESLEELLDAVLGIRVGVAVTALQT